MAGLGRGARLQPMARCSHESALGMRLCGFRLIAPSPFRLLVYPRLDLCASEHVAVRELDGRAIAAENPPPKAICLPVPICLVESTLDLLSLGWAGCLGDRVSDQMMSRDGRPVGVTGPAGSHAVTKPSCIMRQAGGGGFGRLPVRAQRYRMGLFSGRVLCTDRLDCVSTKVRCLRVVSDVAGPARRARAGGCPSWRGSAACRRSTIRVFRLRSD